LCLINILLILQLYTLPGVSTGIDGEREASTDQAVSVDFQAGGVADAGLVPSANQVVSEFFIILKA